jgi:SNF2 family DNA or RNA helicase
MIIDLDDNDIILKFNYNYEIIEKLKKIPGHRWNPIDKSWSIPIVHYKYLLNFDLNNEQIKFLKNLENIVVHTPPASLFQDKIGIIRQYQWHQYNFLMTRKKVFLLDEPGLGKTVISLLAAEKLFEMNKIKQAFIFAPLPIIHQWPEELHKFFKINDDDIVIVNDDRKNTYKKINEFKYKYIILNYEKARLEDFNIPNNSDKLLILDEATKIKNYKTQAYKSIKNIIANYKFILSGRVLQNSPAELYTLNTLLDNNILGTFNSFREKYAYSEYDPNLKITRITSWHDLDKLGEEIKYISTYLRAEDVLDLPPIITEIYKIYPTEEEKLFYKNISLEIEALIKEDFNIKYTILPLITLEKEFCDSPKLITMSNSKYLPQGFNFDIDGSKLSEIENIVEMSREGQIIIFTQYEHMTKLLYERLSRNYTCGVYAGNASQDVIKDFQDKKFRILISTDKGAYGLNLGNAQTIINYDLPWNPAVLKQRIGRISGFRQGSNVMVINVIVDNQEMIESRIREILHEKNVYYEEVFDNA